jgi:hypothetical protein
MKALSKEQFDAFINDGPYAFPGGYIMYVFMSDGEPLCHGAAKENYDLIVQAIADNDDYSGWLPTSVEINYEDDNLFCSHTWERILPSYGDDDDVDTSGYDYNWHGYGITITTPSGSAFMQGEEAAELYDQLEAATTNREWVSILMQYEHVCE